MGLTKQIALAAMAVLPCVRAFGSLPSTGTESATECACFGNSCADNSGKPSHIKLDENDERLCQEVYCEYNEILDPDSCEAAVAILSSDPPMGDGVALTWHKTYRNPRNVPNCFTRKRRNKVFFNEQPNGVPIGRTPTFQKICALVTPAADNPYNLQPYLDPTGRATCGAALAPRPYAELESESESEKTPGICSRSGDSCNCEKWNDEAPREITSGGCPVCAAQRGNPDFKYEFQKKIGGDKKSGYMENSCCTWTPTPTMMGRSG